MTGTIDGHPRTGLQYTWLPFLIGSLALCASVSTTAQPRPDPGDEAALRALATHFFAAYQKEDMADFMSLWSPKSPELANRKNAMAQLWAAEGSLLNLDYARATLPGHLSPGDSTDITITLPPLDRPGRYMLKFDLVNEGVDWFERCGSPTTTKPLWVLASR